MATNVNQKIPVRDNLNDAISHFQQQIGAYDKELWEEHVEQKESQGLDVGTNGVQLKTGRVKTELIDVDLVRGSTFTKAKPEHAWLATTWKGLLRVFFFPFYYTWWKQQLSASTFYPTLVLYFLQLHCVATFFIFQPSSEQQAIYAFEVIGPMLLMLVLGTTYTQVASTNAKTKSLLRRSSRRNLHRSQSSHTKSSSSKTTINRTSPKKSRESRDRAKAASPKRKQTLKTVHGTKDSSPSPNSDSAESVNANGTSIQKVKSLSGEVLQNEENAEKEDKDGNTQYVPSADGEEISGCAEEDFTLLNTPISEMEVAGDLLCMDSQTRESGESPTSMLDRELESIISSQRQNHTTEAYCRRRQQRVLTSPKSLVQKPSIGALSKNPRSCLSSRDLRESRKNRLTRVSILENARKFSPVEEESPQEILQHMSDSEGTPSDTNQPNLTLQGQDTLPHPRGRNAGRKGRRSRVRNPDGSQDSEGDTSPDMRMESEQYFQPISRPLDSDLDEASWEETGAEGSSFSSDSGNSSDTGSSTSEEGEEEEREPEGEGRGKGAALHFEDPFKLIHSAVSSSSISSSALTKVRVRIFEDNVCKKTDMSVLQISCAINTKVHSIQASTDYIKLGFLCSFILAIIPFTYRIHITHQGDGQLAWFSHQLPMMAIDTLSQMHWASIIVLVVTSLERFYLSSLFFFLLAVAERTYKQRCLFAKYFSHLTSARKARQSSLPHFRLDRVSNIKAWLSLRSFLKKRGPQRSVNVIVSSACLLTLMLVSILCTELLQRSMSFVGELYNWEVVAWTFCLSPFLLRFITLGSDINKKFRNTSVLLTEQINLYLNMERKPQKKENLMLANNVLKLASKLLKEVETPFKLSGLSMNPVLYNITRVLVLSAFSGVLTELLGFKLKLWKIKA